MAAVNWEALRRALGTDPDGFPTDVLIRAPSWFTGQVDLLVEAVRCTAGGASLKRCQSILSEIRSRELQDWYIGVGQWSGTYRASVRNVPKPPTSGGADYPRQLRYALLERDGFRCRYCGSRVVCLDELKVAAKLLEVPELVSGRANRARHGIRLIVQATFDHVIPAARFKGEGVNNMTNLVTSCWSCNFGKAHFTLEELGLTDPRERVSIADSEWNGLVYLRQLRKITKRSEMGGPSRETA